MHDVYYAMNPWWEGRPFDIGLRRSDYLTRIVAALNRKQIEFVIGGRRVGKTTLMRQLVADCLDRGTDPRDLLYLALDHPRLSSTSISEHLRAFRQLHDHERTRKVWLIFDEAQESPNWEAELKAVYDLENVKIVCTGSTAALLASQGGKLTGRQALLTVYPLSFGEFLQFRGYQFSRAETYRYVGAADEYLETGGYPENVLHPSDTYLAQLLDDVVARDLIRLRHIRRPDLVMDLLRLLAAGVGTRTSYNRLARSLDLSLDTVKEYVSHLIEAYVVKDMSKWTTSHTERTYAQRKIYFMDTSFKAVLTGPGDRGAKAENAVFLDLLRRGTAAGYFAESERELDFAMGAGKHPLAAIEVKYDETFDWADRRFSGPRLFLQRFPACPILTIVTRDANAALEVGQTRVQAVPLWRHLLRD